MSIINNSKKVTLVLAVSLLMGMASTVAFARDRDDHWGRSRHEQIRHGHDRFDYYEGRYYRTSLFGAILGLVLPPAGVTVTYLPRGHRTIYVGGTRYYEYDNVYYQACPTGYVVVQQPVVTQYVSPNVMYVPAANAAVPSQAQAIGDRETVTLNVPRISGGYTAITLVRYANGFVGPQGEFYSSLPSGEELRVRYGN
ncbi:MAG: hypothetical protein PHQ96_00835 [Candidatus Omnitrophica bacterium]|nr:hypothetical protein [Candidatus Omnitrophota bacterium]